MQTQSVYVCNASEIPFEFSSNNEKHNICVNSHGTYIYKLPATKPQMRGSETKQSKFLLSANLYHHQWYLWIPQIGGFLLQFDS